MATVIATLEDFYAHALAIEREAAERYAELRNQFARRGEDVLAGLCGSLAEEEREHFEGLVRAASHLSLPAIVAHPWLEGDAPETPSRELLYNVATPRQLLLIALAAEHRAREFFLAAARDAVSREVRELASIMAAEEVQHIDWVEQAIAYHDT